MMTQSIEIQKYNLISLIIQLNNEKLLANIEAFIQNSLAQTQPQVSEPPAYMRAVKPLRKGVTLEQLKKEQNFQGFSWNEFSKLRTELALEESAEELISLI